MSVLVYIDSKNGKISKGDQEAVYYGSQLGGTTVVTNGTVSNDELAKLGEFGATTVLNHNSSEDLDSQQLTKLVVAAAEKVGADKVVFSRDLVGIAVAPRVATKLNAGLVSGAIATPNADGAYKVNAFSGKAYAHVKVNSAKQVIALTPNSLAPQAGGSTAGVEDFSADLGAARVVVKETSTLGGGVPLPEAELVVSAGRGLKGPENWGIVQDLADALGAATACSRPVADSGWRPHHEHVGQTGVTVRPNLYIAAGISGAIQHLAGVNSSKTIVVINTDPEAPFFKAADYGIVGDAFEVLPKLTEAVKSFKAAQN